MLSQTKATYIRSITTRRGLLARLVDGLVGLDQRHKDRCRLRNADDHVLRDMGMTREDADRAFYQTWDHR